MRPVKEALPLKRFLIFPCILSLVIGLLAGILLPIDLSGKEPSPVLNKIGRAHV